MTHLISWQATCRLGSEHLETFFRVWVPFRTKFLGRQKIGVTGFDKKQTTANPKEVRFIFYKLALRRTATSIRWSSPLFDRGPPGSPAWPDPPHGAWAHGAPNTRPLLTPAGQRDLSLLMPVSLGSASLGPQSTLATSNCKGQPCWLAPLLEWLTQRPLLHWDQGKSYQTFSTKAHATDGGSSRHQMPQTRADLEAW